MFLIYASFSCGDLMESNVSQNKESTIVEENLPEEAYQERVDEVFFENKPVIITKHAQCRMKCRYITKSEVQQIIDAGKFDEKRSDDNPSNPDHCPTHVYYGKSDEDQTIRVVIASCDDQKIAKLVTVIDLDNDYECTCN